MTRRQGTISDPTQRMPRGTSAVDITVVREATDFLDVIVLSICPVKMQEAIVRGRDRDQALCG